MSYRELGYLVLTLISIMLSNIGLAIFKNFFSDKHLYLNFNLKKTSTDCLNWVGPHCYPCDMAHNDEHSKSNVLELDDCVSFCENYMDSNLLYYNRIDKTCICKYKNWLREHATLHTDAEIFLFGIRIVVFFYSS